MALMSWAGPRLEWRLCQLTTLPYNNVAQKMRFVVDLLNKFSIFSMR